MVQSPALVNGPTWQAYYRHSAQIAWVRELTENYTTHLETRNSQSQTDGQPYDGGNPWKGVIGAAYERTVSLPQDRCAERGGDELAVAADGVSGRSVSPSDCLLVLPTSLCCCFQPGTWQQPFRFSSAIPLPPDRSCLNTPSVRPVTREGHATSARTCYPAPSSVPPGLWRSRIPGRGTQKEILVLRNTEQNCFRSLFLKQTCLLWWSVSVLTA